ncbi:hypothetical protein dsx2_0890 [Desulfovibrio sp. X2]|uniref:hypothetical protein n=1 Tax=Desulfovibrio sp. X2 TaxID=941449 RepID=UPI000358D30C|nr:hypothetical protein [Desulfovibrio sp. X2]EPR37544.1 hypothetical protein dsx2_0890 [Desulfovibrio sp. X2]
MRETIQNLPPAPPLSELCARLLHRPALGAPLLADEDYSDRPLLAEMERLAAPGTEIADSDLLRLLAKFFHAYVHDSAAQSVPLPALGLLFDQFHNRRRGAESLDGRDELRARLLCRGFALCMVADLPKSAHILREILRVPLPAPREKGTPFLGLDIGTGTGVLMLAMYLAARRAGYANIRLVGVERDRPTWERTAAFCRGLGIGLALLGDAKAPETYAALPEGKLSFVCNETLPSLGRRLWKEDFVPIGQAMLKALGERLDGTRHFPAALWAHDGRGFAVRLAPDNGFNPEASVPLTLLRAAAIEMGGAPVPLDRIGEPFASLIHPDWLPRLAHRW